MAIFIMQAFKEHPFKPGRSMSNSYHVNCADMTVALTGVSSLVAYERLIHDGNFLVTYVRVSTAVEGDDVFSTVPVNLAGTRSASGDTMPLFNTIRLDVPTFEGGRPSRWHYRGLHEPEVADLVISSGTRLVFTDAWNDLWADLDALSINLVQLDGQTLNNLATCAVNVKQRSMSRRRRKNTI
jgi:hypothetical protein